MAASTSPKSHPRPWWLAAVASDPPSRAAVGGHEACLQEAHLCCLLVAVCCCLSILLLYCVKRRLSVRRHQRDGERLLFSCFQKLLSRLGNLL